MLPRLLKLFLIMPLTKIFAAVLAAIAISFSSPGVQAQTSRQQWVSETYSKLSLEEKIGQLFMVAAYSGGPDYNEDKIT